MRLIVNRDEWIHSSEDLRPNLMQQRTWAFMKLFYENVGTSSTMLSLLSLWLSMQQVVCQWDEPSTEQVDPGYQHRGTATSYQKTTKG